MITSIQAKEKKHAIKFYHHKGIILANLDKWFSLNPIKRIRVVLFVYPNVCFFLSSTEIKLKADHNSFPVILFPDMIPRNIPGDIS